MFSFPAESRIRQSREFVLAFRQKSVSNKWFSIYLTENSQHFAKLGMVVSKKIVAKSVARNFAKRLIREVFRLNTATLPALNFVIRLRRQVSKKTSNEAKVALLELMLSTYKR